jgi:hypothetical protein
MSDPDIIISLTSYPSRIKTVHLAAASLLAQTLRAEKTILWLTTEEFPDKDNELPAELLQLRKKGLEIKWCGNTRSYTKLIPALENYGDSLIITFDDDIIYNKRAVELLYKCHQEHPKDIIAHRVTRMYYNEIGELVILPRSFYANKIAISENYAAPLKEPSFFNKLTGCAGTLYPPGCLHKDVLDKKTFLEIAPTNDDIWFWLQAVRNNTRIRVPRQHFPTLHYAPDTQKVALTHINDSGEKLFFIQLKKIIEKYPDIKDKLEYDNTANARVITLLTQSGKIPGAMLRKIVPKLIKKSLKLLFYPLVLARREILYRKAWNTPKETTDKKYYHSFKTHINYEAPKSLNEKIHWLKFYSDTSQWPMLADKYRVREYVTSKGFGSVLNELYAVYNHVKDIDIANLPNSFVMKKNNGSGDILIVRDKTKFTNRKIQKYFGKKKQHGVMQGEYHYRYIKPCIIAEKFLVEDTKAEFLTDYKFYCFNGKVEFLMVCSERNKKGYTVDTYDTQWRHYNVDIPSEISKPGNGAVKKPASLNQMIAICAKLSEGIPFARIDFYEIDGAPVFGEITLTPAAGFIKHYTQDFLYKLGEYIELPEKINNDWRHNKPATHQAGVQ